jgi:hypothetical protein
MDEERWLACTDPGWLLMHLTRGGRRRERERRRRKLRLYGCACCRRVWRMLPDERSREAVEVAELCADGLADDARCRAARAGALEVCMFANRPGVRAAECAFLCLAEDEHIATAFETAAEAAAWATASPEEADNFDHSTDPAGFPHYAAERRAQVGLIRCIFGNPFRPVAVPRACLTWNGGAPVKLARAAYEERALPAGTLDNTRLAILADALEEAGCQALDLLTHVRDGGEHYRGCWAVDTVLVKV